MPPSKNGMQRSLYKGIPVWVNEAQDMFIYGGSEPFIQIGNAKGLLENWKELYKDTLDVFRSNLEPRSRTKKI